jgi:exosome complex exonuclease RRP6
MQDEVTASLVKTTRAAGQIANEDLSFHRSLDHSIAQHLNKQNARLLNLTQLLTDSAVAGTSISAPKVSDVDAVEDNWRGLVDVLDNLLEKADACLDEYTGVIKRLGSPKPDSSSYLASNPKAKSANGFRNQDMPKPQLLFDGCTDNSVKTAFKPLLRTKPHATVPLEDSIEPRTSQDGLHEYDTRFYLSMIDCGPTLKGHINRLSRYKHPYEAEIHNFHYPPSVYRKSAPTPYLPFESTTAVFVDTPEALLQMLAELKTVGEIAIDLEHHDIHSFIGLVSLMQISTREKDWVVDTLKPWRQDLEILNEVFADPKIVKVIFYKATILF